MKTELFYLSELSFKSSLGCARYEPICVLHVSRWCCVLIEYSGIPALTSLDMWEVPQPVEGNCFFSGTSTKVNVI